MLWSGGAGAAQLVELLAQRRWNRPPEAFIPCLDGELGAGRLYVADQAFLESLLIEPRGNRRQEAGAGRARPEHEAVAAPVEAGIDGDRHHRHAQRQIQACDAEAVVGRGERRPARTFGEDDDLRAGIDLRLRFGEELGNRLAAPFAVDRDGVERLRRPTKEGDVEQLALGDEGRERRVRQDGEDVPVALVLGGDDGAARWDIFGALDAGPDADDI